MNYEIELVDLEPQPLAMIRAESTPETIGKTLMDLLPRVLSHLTSLGVTPKSPPMVRYLVFEKDRVNLEGGMAVEAPVPPKDDISSVELPGGKAAATWHVGPYEKLSEAYTAMQKWMSEQGEKPGGAPWEVYWTDPAEEPDSSKWRTQVVWPLA